MRFFKASMHTESPGVFPGSPKSSGNFDVLKLACPENTLVLMMLLPGNKLPRFQMKFLIQTLESCSITQSSRHP